MRLGYAAAIQFGKRLRDESTTPVAFIEPTDEQEAWRIFQRYKDHRFSFVDCTSFAIMERMKLNTVLAFDEDFRKLESGSSFHRSTAIYIGIRNATHSSDVLNTVGVQRVSYHHATGPYFQHALSPGQGQALVYFYRPPLSEVPSRYSTWIYVDYQFIGKLDHGGYFFSILSSGRHRISNSPNDTSEDLGLICKVARLTSSSGTISFLGGVIRC